MNKLLAMLLLLATCSTALAVWVYPPTGNENPPYSLPVDGGTGALVYNPQFNAPVMYTNGWRAEVAPPTVSTGYVRFVNSPAWTNGVNGSNAFYSYTDVSQATLDAIASSNAAASALAQAIAYTNAMTNAWLTAYHTNAAHIFRALGAKYLTGFPTNTTWTYASAMNAFQAMPTGSQTITQLWDNVFWQRAYNQLSDFFPFYCPSTNPADATDYDMKSPKAIWLWKMIP